MSEQDITRAIINALLVSRVWCWRVNSGVMMATYRGKERAIKMAPSGSPDILGVLKGGRLFGLEVKTRTGKQRPSQVKWQAKAEQNGVKYRVVRSVGEALRAVAEWSVEP